MTGSSSGCKYESDSPWDSKAHSARGPLQCEYMHVIVRTANPLIQVLNTRRAGCHSARRHSRHQDWCRSTTAKHAATSFRLPHTTGSRDGM